MKPNNWREKGQVKIAGNNVLRHEVEPSLDCGTILFMNPPPKLSTIPNSESSLIVGECS